MTASPVKPIRLLLVDDHEVVRVGLRTLLQRAENIRLIGEAGTAAEAIRETDRLTPDVLLLDIRLPDGSGFDVCRHAQKKHPDIRVLVLTSYADDEIVHEAIRAGADGYLLKEIDAEALITAIENVAAGKSILDPAVTSRVFSHIRSTVGSGDQDKYDMLSAQERRVIALVAEGKTNKEIGVELNLSDKTVKNYLSNILEKLQFTRRSQAAAFYVQKSIRKSI
ncbi:MAG: response regulator transcription factor [Verrucomicrobia bacterium]|nr:response regulator transcription factor [Verrucomicrobiota bacterium]